MDALEADIDQRCRRARATSASYQPRAVIGRPSGPSKRRGLDVVEPGHLAALIDDAAGEPAAAGR